MAKEAKPKEKADTKAPAAPAKKGDFALREEAMLAEWERLDIFKKTLNKAAPKGGYTFYDGPPFANGQPHYGHLLAGTIKDAIPRFKTMQGYRVARRWGWDCHGLPVENLVEKELGLKTKKDIEDLGIEKFNNAAKESVMRFADDWRKIVPRLGRFVDMEDDYRTMDPSYTQSVWWSFKRLHDKGLIYRGFKPMHICPRCETTLSNFEVTQGYQDIKDVSVFVKFALADEPGTYLLAWTTTPWTLPGNVALAINPGIEYATVEQEGSRFVLAAGLVGKVFGDGAKTVLTVSGQSLVGRPYKPLFPYYANDAKLVNRERGWKVYAADFVTTEDGTGIVHIAPAFGEDDLNLGQKEKFPFVQHVGMDGRFADEVKDFAGESVKPKGDHTRTDKKVIEHLTAAGTLFKTQDITHAYPHCWRCETPLLNYAASSWFVKVTDLKDDIIAENKKVSWVPEDIRDGRFGKWLEGARDWAISRSRYWGAPIPVWTCDTCGKDEVIGSVSELSAKLPQHTRMFVVRHGEAENNTKYIVSSAPDNPHHLTEQGKAQAKEAALKLKGERVDVIIASPLLRTRETADIIRKELGLPESAVQLDKRLVEVDGGEFDGMDLHKYHEYFDQQGDRFVTRPPGGECHEDVRSRVMAALYDIEARFEGKTVVIVSHDSPVWLMVAGARGMDRKAATAFRRARGRFFSGNGEVHPLNFVRLPHGDDYVVDLHRPYIDEVVFSCACGGTMRRTPDVFDCWFESGAMPYAESRYLGEPTAEFDPTKGVGYPADFIAEGLDQTRGWFYSLIVLGTALFGKAPYKQVIVNGLILAENGQKMSKRLKNYPEPMEVVNKYGADALRMYLLSSPVVHGEELRFSERGVDEVAKKTLGRLHNTLAFLKLNNGLTPEAAERPETEHVLDQWMFARLFETAADMTSALSRGELDRAVRPIGLFVDDLSTWYLRRSRDRFRGADAGDAAAAAASLRYLLCEFSKLIAPFAPFYADFLYREVAGAGAAESVHLESWPTYPALSDAERTLIADMQEARRIVSVALEARAAANIKVRQPLASFETPSAVVKLPAFAAIIADELNVKAVRPGPDNRLDTTITPELKAEGQLRDLIRAVQDLRKQSGLRQGQAAVLSVGGGKAARAALEPLVAKLRDAASIDSVSWDAEGGEPLDLDGVKVTLSVVAA